MSSLKKELKQNEVIVRFRFKDDKIGYRIVMSKKQYQNFAILPIIEYCEVVRKLGKPIPKKEFDKLDEKLKIACISDTSHTKRLTYDA